MPEIMTLFDNSLITSSPMDISAFYTTNNALNQMIKANAPLLTPVWNYIVRLTKTSKWLHA